MAAHPYQMRDVNEWDLKEGGWHSIPPLNARRERRVELEACTAHTRRTQDANDRRRDVEITSSHTNSLAPSTREMGPGARRETLNHHWNGWNF